MCIYGIIYSSLATSMLFTFGEDTYLAEESGRMVYAGHVASNRLCVGYYRITI